MGGNEGKKPRVDPNVTEPDGPLENQNTRVQCLKREVEQLYHNNLGALRTTTPILNGGGSSPGTNSNNGNSVAPRKFETEVFEMKRQLWLNTCRPRSDNQNTSPSAASDSFNGSTPVENNKQSFWNIRARTQSMGSGRGYSRAFVAPTCLRDVGRQHSINNNIQQRFGNTDDMQNLLEDIYDL